MRSYLGLVIIILVASARGDEGLAAKAPVKTSNSAEHPAGFNSALHDELSAMVQPDQAVRQKRPSEMTKEDFDRMRETDAAHEKRMREIVGKFGWPGRSLVGDDGSMNAWLLVQHCSLEFEKECLPLLEQAVAKADASPKNYAYLLDRVRMYEGKPQVYGTQFLNGVLYTLEDPDHVDERRKSVGLGSLAEYEKRLRGMQ
jgi:hypothetical protein